MRSCVTITANISRCLRIDKPGLCSPSVIGELSLHTNQTSKASPLHLSRNSRMFLWIALHNCHPYSALHHQQIPQCSVPAGEGMPAAKVGGFSTREQGA
jgi:hypothetical protein